MNNVTVVCDRCGQQVEGCESEHFTGGFYRDWRLMMDAHEHILCDDCAHRDPRYLAVYPSSAS